MSAISQQGANQQSYGELSLYIGGEFVAGGGRATQPVTDPATGDVLGQLPHASSQDLDGALAAAEAAFAIWKRTSPPERSRVLRRAGELLRSRVDQIARNITLDQGRPLAESVTEVMSSADQCDWHAEECRRIYGRVIPARFDNVRQIVLREPVGVCAAFTPWNYPLLQAVKKVAAAVGAGCAIVLKGPEDTPSGVVAMARAFADAGPPAGVLNVVWGVPREVSQHLIASPIVRKVSFTGSVAVGKQLAALAGAHMKRTTMELGGHAPVVIFEDADVDRSAELLFNYKFRNSGQICLSPTRFYLHESIHDRFVSHFMDQMTRLRLGHGLDTATTMGPVAHERRVRELERICDNAHANGATIRTGGGRHGNVGSFFQPTVITDVPDHAAVMKEEPLGPVAAMTRFRDTEEVIQRANSLPFGLSSYVFTGSTRNAMAASSGLEAGLVNINHWGQGLPETPLGGVKDSGMGSEGGTETFDGYLVTKFISQMD